MLLGNVALLFPSLSSWCGMIATHKIRCALSTATSVTVWAPAASTTLLRFTSLKSHSGVTKIICGEDLEFEELTFLESSQLGHCQDALYAPAVSIAC